jgi:hypothetical protein
MADPRNLPPPRIDVPRNGTISNGAPSKSTSSDSKSNLLIPFLGGFAAMVVLALIGGGGYLGWTFLHSSESKATQSPLMNATTWQEGQVNDATLSQPEKPDIGWWTKTFDLPNLTPQVADFLKRQGLIVNSIEPVHYKDDKDAATITYQVDVQVPGELLRVPMTAWMPTNQDEARFARMLVLSQGLPLGIYWDTAHAQVAAHANSQKLALLTVHWNKVENSVTADRLLPRDLVTPQEVANYANQTETVMTSLQQHIQAIDAQVQQQAQQQIQQELAQIPPDPAKPTPQVAHFGGDGSGEPTKSAERIGGGAAAGAAGGALFGAAAGNAGMGAGIGAGVGLLGGIIYNAVSKSNDKKKLEREVADENAEALDNWKSQCHALAKQRSQIKASEPQVQAQEREAALNALADQINANHGFLDPISAPAQAPINDPAPAASQPTGPM